jgi:short-subunit dehydrogenase
MNQKVIVISGGTDGLGKSLAKLLSPTNTVIILSPTREKLTAVSQEFSCEFEECDITNYAQVQQVAKNVIQKHGQIDTLINCAGIWIEGPLESNQPEKIEAVLKVNSLGTIFLSHAFVPQFKKQNDGQIINVISMAGLTEKPDRSVYYASKWAVTGFTKCLRLELEPFGIQVIGCYPGKMNTTMFTKAGFQKDLSSALDPNMVATAIVKNLSQELPIDDLELDTTNA